MKKKQKVFTKMEKAFRKIFQTGPHDIATRLICLQPISCARDFFVSRNFAGEFHYY